MDPQEQLARERRVLRSWSQRAKGMRRWALDHWYREQLARLVERARDSAPPTPPRETGHRE